MEAPANQIIRLPWSKKPFRANKGVASEPSPALEDQTKAKDQLLTAIGMARRWVGQLLTGETLAAIAKKEGRSERQIRLLLSLAFLPPTTVRDVIGDRARVPGITEMAKSVPLSWKQAEDGHTMKFLTTRIAWPSFPFGGAEER